MLAMDNGFAEIAKYLYDITHPLGWVEAEQRASKALKTALVSSLVLANADITKQSHLYLDEARDIY